MTKWEVKLYDIERYLMRKYGVDSAYRMIAPLSWYCNTARASIGFLNALVEAKTFVVGRILARDNGMENYEITIDRIKEKILAY